MQTLKKIVCKLLDVEINPSKGLENLVDNVEKYFKHHVYGGFDKKFKLDKKYSNSLNGLLFEIQFKNFDTCTEFDKNIVYVIPRYVFKEIEKIDPVFEEGLAKTGKQQGLEVKLIHWCYK